MSPEKINITIAEYFGFLSTVTRWQFLLETTDGRIEDCRLYKSKEEAVEAGKWMECYELGKAHTPKSYERICTPPNYHGDLNAMHEAVGSLTDEQREEFRQHLSAIWKRDYNSHCGSFPSQDDSVNATAAQRAEAFLRVVNKWID